MRHAWLSLVLVFAPSLAFAQHTQPDAPPPAAPVPAQAPIAVPPPPKTDDPMLAPVPAAAKNIASWNDALAYIRSRSADLHIALLEVRRAEAQSREAIAALLPSINGNASATHQIITTPSTGQPQINTSNLAAIPAADGNTYIGVVDPTKPTITPGLTGVFPTENTASASLTLIQPIIAPRAWNGLKTAAINEDVNRLSVDDTKRQIALNVANAVIGVVTAERVAELNRVGLKSSLERLELTQRKKALGAATGLDVIRVQQDVENARATLVTGDESLRQARETLGLALGVAEPIGVEKGLDLNGLAESTLASCKVSPSIDDRPDIAAARRRVDLAHRGVVDIEAAFLPIVNAQSTLATSTAATAISSANSWNIQAVLSWNIWDGGVRYGQLRDTRAQEDEARERLDSQHRAAQIQVDQARRGVDVAEQSRHVAADARALAAETDRLTQAGYLEGSGTSLELVTAASALRQAEINLALQEFGLVKARVLAMLTLATCPY